MGKASDKEAKSTAKQSVGKEIQAARRALGLTQEQLAGLFEVDEMTISRWERDNFLPQAIGAIRLAFECLRLQRLLDNNDILSSLDQRRAELDAFSSRLKKERAKFEKSTRK